MVFPGTNLSSFNDHKYYTLVHQLTLNTKAPAHNPCATQHVNPYEYHGFSVSILCNNDSIETKHYTYTVDCKYKVSDIDSVTGNFTLTQKAKDTLSHKSLCATQAALCYSVAPFQRFGCMHDFLNIIYSRRITDEDVNVAKVIMQQLLSEIDTNTHMFKHIDTQYMHVMLSGNITDHIYSHVNNTYVNVVHDCHTLCAQVVLSDSYKFMSDSDIHNYGLLCAHRLSEINMIECECECIHTSYLAISAAIVMGSITSLFLIFSNSKCAKAIRACCISTYAAMRVRDKRIQEEIIEIEHKNAVLLRYDNSSVN